MKILFVFYNEGSGLSTHNGIALLSAIAKQQGHETKLLHFHDKLDTYKLTSDWIPDVVAFTATDFEYAKINELAKDMRQWLPEVFFLLGGKSAVEIATKDITNSPFNAFCIGEAELSWKALLKHIKSEDIGNYKVDGFWFKMGNTLYKNPPGENVKNLDDLPFPDYSIFDMDKIIEAKGGWFNVQFSRGCMYDCTYCYVTADKAYQGENYKLRNNSVDYAMRYLEWMVKKYPSIRVFNLDDELPISIEMQNGRCNWWLNFCRQFKQQIYDKYNVEFVANGRVNLLTEEIIKTTKEAGCREIRIGFETGSENIRFNILKKYISDEQIENCYKLCNKYGLNTTSFTMIGIPHEKESDIWETIKMTAKLKPNIIRLTFCYPFENTKLYDYCKQYNLLLEDRLYKQFGYFEESVIKTIEEQKLNAFRFMFPWFVNLSMLEDIDLLTAYSTMIKIHLNDDFKQSSVREKIINIDKQLSDICGNKLHYAYHPNGYFQFVER